MEKHYNLTLEHTILKPNANPETMVNDLATLSKLSVPVLVIPPYYVKLCAEAIKKNSYKINLCTVIGFPLGYNTLNTKVAEIKQAIEEGADELDVVLNNTLVTAGDYSAIQAEFAAYRQACGTKTCKVILETSQLNLEQILKITELLVAEKIDFVKTSTGFVGDGAQLDHIKAIKAKFGNTIKIKASGGIRTLSQVKEFVDSGANKIGTSSTENIMKELAGEKVEAVKGSGY